MSAEKKAGVYLGLPIGKVAGHDRVGSVIPGIEFTFFNRPVSRKDILAYLFPRRERRGYQPRPAYFPFDEP